jgi:hypothetical protein
MRWDGGPDNVLRLGELPVRRLRLVARHVDLFRGFG